MNEDRDVEWAGEGNIYIYLYCRIIVSSTHTALSLYYNNAHHIDRSCSRRRSSPGARVWGWRWRIDSAEDKTELSFLPFKPCHTSSSSSSLNIRLECLMSIFGC